MEDGNFTNNSFRYVLSSLRARIPSRTLSSLEMNKLLLKIRFEVENLYVHTMLS